MTTATEAGYVEMRIAKVVGLSAADNEPHRYVAPDGTALGHRLAPSGGAERPRCKARLAVAQLTSYPATHVVSG